MIVAGINQKVLSCNHKRCNNILANLINHQAVLEIYLSKIRSESGAQKLFYKFVAKQVKFYTRLRLWTITERKRIFEAVHSKIDKQTFMTSNAFLIALSLIKEFSARQSGNNLVSNCGLFLYAVL